MSPEQWQRLQEIFLEADQKQGAERVALLDRACAGDVELRRSVERMLAATGMSGFLESAVGGAAVGIVGSGSGVEAGQTIGPYRVVGQVGRGGMGAVYLAQRADQQFEKQIAIKVMRAGLDTPELRERFRTERQILARLEHPNIARLLDGGAMESGLPYVAMEYVQGVPVTDYVQSQGLSIRTRIRLFLSICEAVEYAHRNLVVHRDIKPANILVTAEGVPKLLDFGIARLVSAEGTAVGVTRIAERLLTPEFASPEQIRGEAVTTAADIYSLGVLLYILLTGHSPYPTEGLSPTQIERLVCETDPVRPSVAVSAGPLRRELAGDLDQIVGMAMRKDPAARYGSVGQLEEDLQRYLDGFPVNARKGAWSYAASKFVRRHRVAVIASAVLLIVAVAFAVGMGILARKLRIQRDVAQSETRAEQQVSDFLVKLFQSSNTDDSRGRPLTARELLDNGVASIDRELSAQPEVHARLLRTMGQAYESLGVYTESENLYRKALAIRRGIGDGKTLAVAESLKDISETLRMRSKFTEGEATARESLRIRQKLLGPVNIDVAESLNTLGLMLWQKGDPAAAEPWVRQALDVRTRIEGPGSVGDAVYMSNLAGILRARNDLPGAESLYRSVVDLRRRLLGQDHPRTAMAMHGLALVLYSRGSYAEAEALFRQTLELRRRLLGENHPDVTTSATDLAQVLRQEAKYPEARDLARRVLAARLARAGPENKDTAAAFDLAGSLDEDTGRYREALGESRRAMEIRREVLGERSIWYAKSLVDTAQVMLDRGDLGQAETLARESLEIRRAVLGARHMDTDATLALLGRIAWRQHDLGRAESLFRESLATDTAILDRDHPQRAATLAYLGGLLLDAGRPREAEPLLRESLAIREKKLPANHWATAITASALGACLTAQQRYGEAEQLLERGARVLAEWREVRPAEAEQARANVEHWRALAAAHP